MKLINRFNSLNTQLGTSFHIPNLHTLILYASSFCNAKCDFCELGLDKNNSNFFTGINSQNINTPAYMTQELFEKIMSDEIVSKNKPRIKFLMSEPLLNKNLFSLLKLAKQKGLYTAVATNGFLLEKRIGDIGPYLNAIQVSIDGLQDSHDKVRGEKFFISAIDGIKKTNTLFPKINICVNYTLTPYTANEFLQLAHYLDNEVQITTFKIQFMDFVSTKMKNRHNDQIEVVASEESGFESILEDVSKMDFDEIFSKLTEVKNSKFENIKNIRIIPDIDSPIDISDYFSEEGKPFKNHNLCNWPYNQVAINTAGDVYWHMRCYNNYKLGNLANASLSEIFMKSKEAVEFRKSFKKNNNLFPACARCCGSMQRTKINNPLYKKLLKPFFNI